MSIDSFRRARTANNVSVVWNERVNETQFRILLFFFKKGNTIKDEIREH